MSAPLHDDKQNAADAAIRPDTGDASTRQRRASEGPLPSHRHELAGRSRMAIVRMTIIVLTVFIADIVSKYVAFEHVAGRPVDVTVHGVGGMSAIPPHEPVIVIPHVFAFKLTLNQGAVFGLGQGYRWVFIAISIVAVFVIAAIFVRSRRNDLLMHTSLALILAGALGNLYDRVMYGMVRDLLYMFPGVSLPFGWRWPGGDRELYPWIFNIADVALLFGMLLLFIHIFRAERYYRDTSPDSKTET